jgi:hypothetical protein
MALRGDLERLEQTNPKNIAKRLLTSKQKGYYQDTYISILPLELPAKEYFFWAGLEQVSELRFSRPFLRKQMGFLILKISKFSWFGIIRRKSNDVHTKLLEALVTIPSCER